MADRERVRIRAAAHDWAALLAIGGAYSAILIVVNVATHPIPHTGFTFEGGLVMVMLLQSLRLRACGVDLTPTAAETRGLLRRRTILWNDVLAVTRHPGAGTWRVRLELRNGTGVNLRAPTIALHFGTERYERELGQITQWWQAHSVNATESAS